MCLNVNWFKSYDTSISISRFLRFCTKHSFAFCTNKDLDLLSTSKNDGLNLSFVKDKHIVGEKMARYGRKMAIYQFLFFAS